MENKLCWVCEKNEGGAEYSLCKKKHKHYKPCQECVDTLNSFRDKTVYTGDDHLFVFNFRRKIIKRLKEHV